MTQKELLTAIEALPSLSLPQGGGAIPSMGEKFAVNPVTGTGNVTVVNDTYKLHFCQTTAGLGPQIACDVKQIGPQLQHMVEFAGYC